MLLGELGSLHALPPQNGVYGNLTAGFPVVAAAMLVGGGAELPVLLDHMLLLPAS